MECGFALERTATGRHLVEDGSEGEDIGPEVQHFTFGLLGRHISSSAYDPARFSDRKRGPGRGLAAFVGVDSPGEAEIEHLHLSVMCDDQVTGLEIAVEDARGMSFGERICCLGGVA